MKGIALVVGSLLLIALGSWRVQSRITQLEADHAAFLERRAQQLGALRAQTLAGLDILGKDPFFAPAGKERDAGSVLNPLFLKEAGATQALPELPDALRSQVRDLQSKDWQPDLVNALDLRLLDFGWISRLKEFDHWETEGFAQGLLPADKRNPVDAYVTLRLPELGLLRDWAALRLVAGIQAKNERDAFEQVAQLGRLSLSTESMPGMVAALRVRELLARAQAYLQANQPSRASRFESWVISDAEQPTTLRKMALDLPHFIGTFALNSLQQEIQSRASGRVCFAIRESMVSQLGALPFFAQDPEFELAQGQFGSFLASQQNCRLAQLRKAWEDRSWHAQALAQVDLPFLDGLSTRQLPVGFLQWRPIRNAFGRMLLQLGPEPGDSAP